jgi:transcriptional regulator with XRE-family HTH domain
MVKNKGGVTIMSNDIARKIKELRLANGLTLEEVANVVGVGKSTVRKWETGTIANMKRDKIALLAKALSTTPAYLMGWFEEEEPVKNTITVTEDEQKLLDLFRKVPESQQQMVLQMINVALKSIE